MGGQRRFRAARCEECGLHLQLCACAERPSIRLGHRLWLIQNNHERNKPTNTGRMVELVVEETRLVRYAVRGEVFDDSFLREPARPRVLIFPRRDADGVLPPALCAEDFEDDTEVVLLDGTWGQCSRMGRRIEALAELPARVLPPGPPSHWIVREAPDQARMSTMDAAIRVVRIGAGDESADAMQAWFDLVTARMLFMKGKLRSPDVPAEWIGGASSSSDG